MSDNLFKYFARIMVILLVLPIHEYAHGWVAYKLGDNTAASRGRLDLNPLAHVDPIGAICLLFFGFGWAKPVPINPVRFTRKISMRAGVAITSLAGPVSNVLFALVTMVLFKAARIFAPETLVAGAILSILSFFISTNLTLAVFNMFPIPPLDGYNVLSYFLPYKITSMIANYQQFFFMGLIVLMNTRILSTPIYWVSELLLRLLDKMTFFLGRI